MPDIRIKYPTTSSVDIGISLASLGSNPQGNFLTGQASPAISNETTPDLDHILSGTIRSGTTPTASRSINVYVVAPVSMSSGTATWPTGFTPNSSYSSIPVGRFNSVAKLAASMTVDNSSNTDYQFGGVSVASLFGGTLPPEYLVLVAQDTAVNLSGSGHSIHYFRVQGQSV